MKTAFDSYIDSLKKGPLKKGFLRASLLGINFFRTTSLTRITRIKSYIALVVFIAGVASGCASNNPQDNHPQSYERHASAIYAPPNSAGGDDFEPTVVASRDYRDPLIAINRAIFAFNEVSYRYLFIPLGKGYTHVTPDLIQRSVRNFFYNIKTPIYAINHALQLKPRDLGINIARFGINSTIGILGLFDPATHWFGIERAPTSFEETLMQYGVGYGFYIVIPLLGPSDLRRGTSVLVEGAFHPASYIADDRDRMLIQGIDYFQDFAPEAESYEQLLQEAEDPYIFMRNLYLQGIQRDADYPRDSAPEAKE